MNDFGPMPVDIKEMMSNDIFLSRLKILIIMIKAYLIGCPLEKYRKHAIIENAHYVFYQTIQMNTESIQRENGIFVTQINVIYKGKTSAWHFFHQRVQLLAVMAKALTEGCPTGKFRTRAINENLHEICETLTFDLQLKDMNFLKVG
jgi:hypothetical protein